MTLLHTASRYNL